MSIISTSQVMPGAGESSAAAQQEAGMETRIDGFEKTDEALGAIALEGLEVRFEVVLGGYGIENEVEGIGDGFHLLLIGGKHDVVGAEATGFFFFAG
jgi:hypothetical protein